MKHMNDVGIRALKQNASAVVAEAARGASITITDRGRPVARIVPLAASPVDEMLRSGRMRRPRIALSALPEPVAGEDLSSALRSMRDAERY